MNSQTDQQLLRDYSERRSETAFAELVRRHVDLVYSAALRMVRDAHLAEDAAQGVFLALAQHAAQLTQHPVLSGWLHRTAQNLAAKSVRADARRRVREQEAAAMNELFPNPSHSAWEQIAPHLDAVLGELSEPDRDAVMLRYFERKSAREMAQSLGVSEEAAQKRVSRGVERLRECLAKRGVTVGVSGLAAVISANAIQAAPAVIAEKARVDPEYDSLMRVGLNGLAMEGGGVGRGRSTFQNNLTRLSAGGMNNFSAGAAGSGAGTGFSTVTVGTGSRGDNKPDSETALTRFREPPGQKVFLTLGFLGGAERNLKFQI